jgi:ferredoxin
MNAKAIKTGDLDALLQAIQRDYTVYAPTEDAGQVTFAKVSAGRKVLLDFSNAAKSPKGLLFPQCEVLCTFEGDRLCEVPLSEERVVLFGVRPCDARALELLDKVFRDAGKAPDPYYMRRRENTLIIALACSEPDETCFCTSTGGDPAGTRGADVLVRHLGESLLFEPCSERGEALMTKYVDRFAEPEASLLDARDKQADEARKSVRKVKVDGLAEKLKGAFESPVWQKVSHQCMGCGACTYLCPTCHCFDITDEAERGKGERVRTWDSCQYALFTLHASGHNPRPSQTERMRQRILHKFLYTVENQGELFCVGCGRCVRSCPVNLDIREIIEQVP